MIKKLLTNGRAMILAYDHGMEHGPMDFNRGSVNPINVLDIALEGEYDGIVLHHGVAEKYHHGSYRDVPLIVKLNGKTNIPHMNPISRQICTVERAMKLGAVAVGYTIYDGSPAETEMFQEFGKIVDKAHDLGLPVIAWMSPKGPEVHDETSTDLLAYSARLGLELGADFVNLKYNKDEQGFQWVIKSAGRCRVLVSGGTRIDDRSILQAASTAMKSGATGIILGRNIWQHPKPFSITKALRNIIFHKMSPEDALESLEL